MSFSELLSLVQLTKEHIFDGKPPPPPSPIKIPPIIKFAAPELQKKAPAPKAPVEIKKTQKNTPCDVKDVLELLKEHCPKLNLIDPPQNKVLMLFDSEPEEEKQILNNMANALKKEGCEVEMVSLERFQPSSCRLFIAERSLFLKDPRFKAMSKRDEKGNLYFGGTRALVIPSLAELIAKPVLRRDLWNQILELIK